MSWLVRLYPLGWRRRYGAEMEAMLAQWRRPGPRETFDLLWGAVDAHLHPQWPPARRWPLWLAAVILAAVAAFASHVFVVDVWRVVMAGGPVTNAADALDSGLGLSPFPFFVSWLLPPPDVVVSIALALAWLGCALATFLLRFRSLPAFSALVALRLSIDWVVYPVVLGVTSRGKIHDLWGCGYFVSSSPSYVAAALAVELVTWGLAAVVVLRRTGVRARVAFAVGCVLELVLGVSPSSVSALLGQAVYLPALLSPQEHPAWFPGIWTYRLWGYPLEPLRIALWAAVLSALGASYPSRRSDRPQRLGRTDRALA